MRVEIAPVGYYVDRIFEPIVKHRADRVYFAIDEGKKGQSSKSFLQLVRAKLLQWKPGIEIRLVRIDAWNMDAAVETLSALIQRETSEGNLVWVNLSTGSKIEAIAGAIACMGNGGTPYYVRMENHRRPTTRQPLASGVIAVEPVPAFGLSVPSPAGLSTLELLAQNDRGLTKRVLIQGLTELGILPKDMPGKTVQARYARLQGILDQLTGKPALVEVEGRHRSLVVKITNRGKLALRIFSPRRGLAEASPEFI